MFDMLILTEIMEKTVVELFAGVGGFRVGLNEVKLNNNRVREKKNFQFVWANQWEPGEKKQFAFQCYTARFGLTLNHINEDISKIDKSIIPNHSLLVGGFPCQDYSVARSLSGEKGIEGKKGVLWWQIYQTLEIKTPPFVLLENVDRLLASPSKQRGRDFGIMIKSLNDLGYYVEWRIINAADYGFPQRRRRVFIFAVKDNTKYYHELTNLLVSSKDIKQSFFGKIFKIKSIQSQNEINLNSTLYKDIYDVSKFFTSHFFNAGYSIKGQVNNYQILPKTKKPFPLIKLIEESVSDNSFFKINEDKFSYLKGSKKIARRKNGNSYFYTEGRISYPDSLELPARTMLTSEGTTNRSTHVIMDLKKNQKRFLTPIECERINQFPDNWTNTNMPIRKRYFMMGNALVTGVVKEIGHSLKKIIEKE